MSERIVAETILGESRAIREVRALVAKVAPRNIPVLIQGATGSGKELVAMALHQLGGRSGAFVPFNTCAIAEGLFEAAIFGQVRGAFTGATGSLRGYLAEAHRGTAFFDEISGLNFALQAKLLRAVETREFRPVGARENTRSEFRLVAATNEDVDALVRAGRFRSDLAHRISGLVIELPALRDRLEDIPILARHFGLLSTLHGRQPVELAECAIGVLADYDWPGNVRELRQVIESAIILSDDCVQRLTGTDIHRALGRRNASREQSHAFQSSARREALADVLERHSGSVGMAAGEIGRSQATVYRWMKELGLHGPGSGRRRADTRFVNGNGEFSSGGENSH